MYIVLFTKAEFFQHTVMKQEIVNLNKTIYSTYFKSYMYILVFLVIFFVMFPAGS